MLAKIRKAVAAFSAAAAVMVAAGLLTGSTAAWITGALAAVGTALAVYVAPANATNDVAPKHQFKQP